MFSWATAFSINHLNPLTFVCFTNELPLTSGWKLNWLPIDSGEFFHNVGYCSIVNFKTRYWKFVFLQQKSTPHSIWINSFTYLLSLIRFSVFRTRRALLQYVTASGKTVSYIKITEQKKYKLAAMSTITKIWIRINRKITTYNINPKGIYIHTLIREH